MRLRLKLRLIRLDWRVYSNEAGTKMEGLILKLKHTRVSLHRLTFRSKMPSTGSTSVPRSSWTSSCQSDLTFSMLGESNYIWFSLSLSYFFSVSLSYIKHSNICSVLNMNSSSMCSSVCWSHSLHTQAVQVNSPGLNLVLEKEGLFLLDSLSWTSTCSVAALKSCSVFVGLFFFFWFLLVCVSI